MAEPTVPDEIVEENEQYLESFFPKASELREKDFTCDVVIKINDQEIHAHKLVLAIGSPYFSMCFFGELVGRQQIAINEIELKDFQFNAVNNIVQYFYTSKIKINRENVKNIFRAADFLQVEWIRDKCSAYIVKNLTTSNCIDLWNFAESLCADQLSSDIVRFIIQNLIEISEQIEFLSLSYDMIKQIHLHNAKKINPKELYIGTLNWTKHNVKIRRSFFHELMKDFPFKSLGKDFIIAYPIKEDLIVSDHQCLKLFSNALLNFISFENIDVTSTNIKEINSAVNSASYIFMLAMANNKNCIQFYNPYNGCLKYIPPHLYILPFAAVATYKDLICISGGMQNSQVQANCILYNTVSDQWTIAKSMNRGKAYHDMVVCNDVLYACGAQFDVERYDAYKDTWNSTQIIPSRIVHDKYISADALDGRIFAIAGNHFDKSTLQSFDPRERMWEHEINKNGSCSILKFNNRLYLSSTSVGYLEEYDLRNKKLVADSAPLIQPPAFGHTLAGFGERIFLFDPNMANVRELNSSQNEWIQTKKPLNGSYSYLRAATPQIFDC